MSDETTYRTTRSELTGRQKRGRHVLAVRMLVARLGWLEAPLRWHAGRVVWDTGEQSIAPGAPELSRAQRTLNRLAEYPHSAKSALGDPEAWRAACQARIELAKRLSALHAPDLETLVQPAPKRDPARLSRLAALLQAEALCRGGLPASPAAALIQAGIAAEPPVRDLLADEEAPLAARTLAALVLGAVQRTHSERGPDPVRRETPAPLRRAYSWGRSHSLPPDPSLAIALLAEESGPELLSRLLQARETRSVLALPEALVWELLIGGEAPERVVRMVEVAADTERLSDRLLHRPAVEDPESPFLNATNAESRREAAEAIAALVHVHAREIRDPEALVEIIRWIGEMLELCPLYSGLTSVIGEVLEGARSLSAERRADFFRLLRERHDWLWQVEWLAIVKPRRKREMNLSPLSHRLKMTWDTYGRPLLRLYGSTGDREHVGEAADLGIYLSLAQVDWSAPELFRCTVELARGLQPVSQDYAWVAVGRLLHRLPDTRAARRVVNAMLSELQNCAPEYRQDALSDLAERVSEQEKDLERMLVLLIPLLPRYEALVKAHPEQISARNDLLRLARELHTATPARAEARVDWLFQTVGERMSRRELDWKDLRALSAGGQVALAVAGEDDTLYRTLVRSILEHGMQIDWYSVESAVPHLERFAGLKPVLGRLFPLQTGRCADLLINLHHATRYGPGALAALERVFGETDKASSSGAVSEAWQAVLGLAPELAEVVNAWRSTAPLLGESPDPPPGVMRTIALPDRLRKEREHLEQRLAREPDRADLQGRVETLRARLADPERLTQQLREEVAERLEIALAEARLRLAERLLDDCHRARLEELVGTLPPDFHVTDDLRNAALLSVDIHANRKHLRRLLRAHFSGETGWREQHPANAAFLARLAERGVDGAAWLGEYPRAFRWPEGPGGKVRLWLEQDPLRILQMGNYFDTCLSLGNCNAFSVVANAVELNKRVIYAADGKGRIIGRKLIAINGEGRLVPFHTYTSCADAKQNEHLARLFRRYCEALARRCGLELDDRGEVPRLFVSEWYNDGVVAWDEGAHGPGSNKSR